MTTYADARPTKQFFISNLTRDLALEDAILDLVDNSIDAFIRTRAIDVSPRLLRSPAPVRTPEHPYAPLVAVTVSSERFIIEDRCGGIDYAHARDSVFRLGRPDGSYSSSLGVYGIGLKRAIFKIGRDITIDSRTTSSGFRVRIDVDQWSLDDSNWTFPLEALPAARNDDEAGTTITIGRLNPEVVLRINDGTLMRRLGDSLASTYSLFLQRFLDIALNDVMIEPRVLPLSTSSQLPPAAKELRFDGVTVELIAGLTSRVNGEWNAERAGWYVLCNGRVVVMADKTDLTGWGLSGPRFVSKYRGFLGIAFFFSPTPADLPWTTTKRGLNLESAVYQAARKDMSVLGEPVIQFLNGMYPSEPAESLEARDMVEQLTSVDVSTVLSLAPQPFAPAFYKPTRSKKKLSVRVQYDVPKIDVERVRKKINKPGWSAGNIGRHTFEYFLKMEYPE